MLFDLDGTLTDSGEGIINCVQLALRHFSIPCEDRVALRAFVGPPLRESFPRFGVPEADVEEAVAVFRSRYNTVGKFENVPYPGVRAMLEQLKDEGYGLYVATSKPEKTALEVLGKFDLDGFFDRICGANFSGSRDTKEEVLAYLLETLPREARPLMIGDTIYDVRGAAEFSIPTVGVSWGYGSVSEMETAGAAAIVDSPEELLALLGNADAMKKILR